MYGWTESEALKMNISALLPDEKRNELKSSILKLNRGESIKPFKSRRKTRDGNILEIWLTITALKDENGRTIEIASTERDLAWLIRK